MSGESTSDIPEPSPPGGFTSTPTQPKTFGEKVGGAMEYGWDQLISKILPALGPAEQVLAGGAIFVRSAGVASSGAQGFRSFWSFKNALGPAGASRHWHHVVEQTPGNLVRFGAETIHNTQNVMRLDVGVHQRISGFYSSIQPFSNSQTVRQWLSTQSFEQQVQFGLDTLRRFGAGP